MKSLQTQQSREFESAKKWIDGLSEDNNGERSFIAYDNYCDIKCTQHGNGVIIIDTVETNDKIMESLNEDCDYWLKPDSYSVTQFGTNYIVFVIEDGFEDMDVLAIIAYNAASAQHDAEEEVREEKQNMHERILEYNRRFRFAI